MAANVTYLSLKQLPAVVNGDDQAATCHSHRYRRVIHGMSDSHNLCSVEQN